MVDRSKIALKQSRLSERAMPTFLIIGAAKAGTTALHDYLEQHPEIYMTHPKRGQEKEPHFFAFEGETLSFRGPRDEENMNQRSVTDLATYEALFRNVSETVRGEASVSYLYYPKAVARIKHYVPDAKLIVMLRDPAQRAFSSFLFLVSLGLEPLRDFGAALDQEEARMNANWHHLWHYQNMGFYYQQLKRYYDAFPKENIRIYFQDELLKNPGEVVKDVFSFLEVDPSFVPNFSARPNVSGLPKRESVQKFWLERNPVKDVLKHILGRRFRTRLKERAIAANLYKPKLDPALRERLVGVYHPDIVQLEELLGRDLSHWRKV